MESEKWRTVGAHCNGVWHAPGNRRGCYPETYTGPLVDIRTRKDLVPDKGERVAETGAADVPAVTYEAGVDPARLADAAQIMGTTLGEAGALGVPPVVAGAEQPA